MTSNKYENDKKQPINIDFKLPPPTPKLYSATDSPVKTCMKINFIFWIAVISCVLTISYYTTGHSWNSYLSGIFSYIFIAFWGYFVHYISHSMNLTKSYQNSTFPLFTFLHKIPIVNTIIETILTYSIDFHANIHHDTSINKQPSHIIVEAIQNFLTEGCLLVMANNYFMPIFMFRKASLRLTVNNTVIMLWALFYATVHNINYNITHPLEHKNHHLDDKTNYGIDIIDIILDTKYNTTNTPSHTNKDESPPITMEDNNHTAINIFLITIFLIWPYLPDDE